MPLDNKPTKTGNADSLGSSSVVTIAAVNFQRAEMLLRGTSPLVMHKFAEKIRRAMMAKQEAGSTANKGNGKKRDARDFEREVQAATHYSEEGWIGIPASAFRSALISACRLVGFKMTLAKLSLFVEADGYDGDDAVPLVKLIADKPKAHEMIARTETGVAYPVVRPIWHKWEVKLRLKWDGDQFTPTDVVNLLSRAGQQVGIQEGRPDSKNSAGMGWGTFEVVS